MLPKINPTKTAAWKALESYYAEFKDTEMKDLFAQDATRFDKYSLNFEDILLDYSKNRIDDKVMSLLFDLAEECGLSDAIAAEFAGEKINVTENMELAMKYGVAAVPTILVFKDGEVVARQVGAVPKAKLQEMLSV